MGNNNSINIEEKSNGIFKINVKDFPNYPIAYIRLCWDPENLKYCIAEDCDTSKKYTKHRKIIVIGMRIPELSDDNIYEQVFYLSTGINSMESIEKFFDKKFISNKEKNTVWLPFSGFGYNYDNLKYKNDLETNIKLIKNYFGYPVLKFDKKTCIYGRFGNYDPNLMQISYCLGSDFWKDNVDNPIFTKYNIVKYPTLESIIEKIPCIYTSKYKNDIDCSIYLNNYIGSSLSINYSPKLLEDKKLILKSYLRFYSIPEIPFDNIKFDYRILNVLYDNEIYLFEKKGIKSVLPFENTFGGYIFWNNYIAGLYKLYKSNKPVFETVILPIINENFEIK